MQFRNYCLEIRKLIGEHFPLETCRLAYELINLTTFVVKQFSIVTTTIRQHCGPIWQPQL